MARAEALRMLGGMVAGAAAGAAAMYLLDPRSGKRRRAAVRDQVVHGLHAAEEGLGRLTHDVENRTRGTVARTRRRLFPAEPVDDERLEARVRSALGRLTQRPGPIRVDAYDGVVTLSGPVADYEVGEVLAGIRRVPGVRRVESRLVPVKPRERGTETPGGRARTGMPPDVLQSRMSPTGRLLVAGAGTGLLVLGLRARGVQAMLAGSAGVVLLARAASNCDLNTLLGLESGHPVVVTRTIEVARPVEEVFAFWSNFRNFPKFMLHLREVRENESGISHWVADGPAGAPVSWNAEVTALEPHNRIAWRSIEGSAVHNSGEVRFTDLAEDRTRVVVRLTLRPPGGTLGRWIASILGADPERELAEDLARLKALLEGRPLPGGDWAGSSAAGHSASTS